MSKTYVIHNNKIPFSEIVNDCETGFCFPSNKGDNLSTVLKKICKLGQIRENAITGVKIDTLGRVIISRTGLNNLISNQPTGTWSISITGTASNITNILNTTSFPALTGDVTTIEGFVNTTLKTVNLFPGTYGSQSKNVIASVNSKGLITSLSEQDVRISQSQVINLVNDLQQFITLNRFISKEIPIGIINGINNAFQLQFIPILKTEHVYKNGLLQRYDEDYTIIGKNIIFFSDSIPLVDDYLQVTYFKI